MHEVDSTRDPLDDLGYEDRDLSLPAVARWTMAFFSLLLMGMVVSLAITWLLASNSGDARTRPVAAVRPLPPAPRLQADPKLDYDTYMTTQRTAIGSYGWIDRNSGIVRIPIDRAIDLVAKRGLPVFKAPPRGAAR